MATDSAHRSYEGAAFVPERDRIAGMITVKPAAISFSSEETSFDLPLDGLTIRSGGAADRLIFFENPALEGTSIFTTDRTILRDPLLAGSRHVEGIHRETRKKRAGLATILLVIAGLVLGLFAARKPLVAAAARRIPPGVEKKLGEVGMRQILLTKQVESDTAVTEPMKKILSEVTRGVGESPYQFQLVIVKDESINAFALPGGYLALHTGLIKKAKSADEIAGVLAHEVAHVTERHSVRQMISSIGIFTIVQAVFGDVSGIIAAAAEGGADLVVRRFSRDAEREADTTGVAILTSAGLSSKGMGSFFQTLSKEEGVASAIPAFLSTHPATQERIDHLRALTEKGESKNLRSLQIDIEPARKALLD